MSRFCFSNGVFGLLVGRIVTDEHVTDPTFVFSVARAFVTCVQPARTQKTRCVFESLSGRAYDCTWNVCALVSLRRALGVFSLHVCREVRSVNGSGRHAQGRPLNSLSCAVGQRGGGAQSLRRISGMYTHLFRMRFYFSE